MASKRIGESKAIPSHALTIGFELARFGIDPETSADVFEGLHDPRNRWNGWACPAFPSVEVDRIIEWTHRVNGNCCRMRWDETSTLRTLVVEESDGFDDPDAEVFVQRIEPNALGLYPVGSYGWCWSEVEHDEPRGPELDAALQTETTRSRIYCDAYNAALTAAHAAGVRPGAAEARERGEASGVAAVQAFVGGADVARVGELIDGDRFTLDGRVWHTCAVVLFGTVAVYADARRGENAPCIRMPIGEGVEVSVVRTEARRYAEAVKTGIVADANRTLIPDTITDFSALHDHVDANDYLIEAGVEVGETGDPGKDLAMTNEVQEVVHRWLADGGLQRALTSEPAQDYPNAAFADGVARVFNANRAF